jgi:hypothetical protein
MEVKEILHCTMCWCILTLVSSMSPLIWIHPLHERVFFALSVRRIHPARCFGVPKASWLHDAACAPPHRKLTQETP